MTHAVVRLAKHRLTTLVACLLLTTCGLMAEARAQGNVFPFGTFENVDATGNPDGWNLHGQQLLKVVDDTAGGKCLQIDNHDAQQTSNAIMDFPLQPAWKSLIVSCRLKAKGLKPGAEGYQNARLSLEFQDEKGKMVGGYFAVPQLVADSDWVSQSVTVEVPAGAHHLRLQAGLLFATGRMWVDDIAIEAFDSMSAAMQSRIPKLTTSFPEGKLDRLDANGQPVGWTIPVASEYSVIQDQGRNCIRVVSTRGNYQPMFRSVFALDEKWVQIGFSVRARLQEFRQGSIFWRQARIQTMFLNADGKDMNTGPDRGLAGDCDWTVLTTGQNPIPDGAKYVAFDVGFSGATGTLDLTDFQIKPVEAGALADAELPAGQTLTWGQEPVETLSATRQQICLNGLWKFIPAQRETATNPTVGWGYIRVPGDWCCQDGEGRPGVVAKGAGGVWQGYTDGGNKAWYERTIEVPAGWRGKSVLLDLARVSTDTQVFVDGVDCGWVNWPFGQIDLTQAIKPGHKQTLRLMVLATPDGKLVARLMESLDRQISFASGKVGARGLLGDVMLVSRPTGAHVSDVFVKTSTRKKEVAIDIELTGIQSAGVVHVASRMLDEKGSAELKFESDVHVEARPVQTITVTSSWETPRLWDVAQPNLYNAEVNVSGAGLDDQYDQEFGFREFWVEGIHFLLNGKEIRLRPTMVEDASCEMVADGIIKGIQNSGFNIAELWPWDHFNRGLYIQREMFVTRADKKGLPVTGVAPAIFNDMIDPKRWANIWDEHKDGYLLKCQRELRRYRNHPSILMWGSSGNTFGGFQDVNPKLIGIPDVVVRNRPDKKKTWESGNEGVALIKSVDPTRPVFFHMAQDIADVSTSNTYMNFAPLQEREEMMSHYVANGKYPWIAVEFGTPLDSSFLRGRNGFDENRTTEPLVTEFCAAYFGNKAYDMEPEEYRKALWTRFGQDQRYEDWAGNPLIYQNPALQALEHLFITNTWRSWRAQGVTGGMVPWGAVPLLWARNWDELQKPIAHPVEFKPGQHGPFIARPRAGDVGYLQEPSYKVLPAGEALIASNGPTLAWIAGAKEAFTAKDHSFTAGAKIEKQISLSNDTREEQPYTVSWSVTVAGRKIAGDERSGHIGVAQNLFLPIECVAPADLGQDKVDGEILLSATIGSAKHQDRFSFRVFSPVPKSAGTLVTFDPAGETSALLKSMGFTLEPWDGKSTDRLLVIGRRALSDHHKLPGDLEAFVGSGGRVIVFGQDPEWLRDSLGLRVSYFVSRRVFPIGGADPVTQGLDATDLRDWAGVSKLVEEYPDSVDPNFKGRRTPGGEPYAYYHWGNRGAISSAAIEKPHFSSWRPLLECEFDLAWSPLLEMEFGRGRVTLCMVDLEDYINTDPAAAVLARQLLEHARTAPISAKVQSVVLMGDDTDAARLDKLGVQYKRGPVPAAGGLLIVGRKATPQDAALQAFVTQGGKVLMLARSEGTGPLGVQLAARNEFDGAVDAPTWPEAAGLSRSDLRLRTGVALPLVTSGCEIGANGFLGRRTIGSNGGVVVFCQLDPDALPADSQTYLRYSRWRQSRALAQVLANLGATFRVDARVFHPVDVETAWLAGIWRGKQTITLTPSPAPDQGYVDPGISQDAKTIIDPKFDDSSLESFELPKMLPIFSKTDGEVVLRKRVTIPKEWEGKELSLSLGNIDDFDDVFFNGQLVGHTGESTKEYWAFKRKYKIPGGLVKAGEGVLVVRVFDRYGGGGFGGTASDMSLKPDAGATAGNWYYPDYREDFELGDDPFRYFRW